jgi:hypothetical protein
MDLEQALGRIAELEGQVTALADERDTLAQERDTLHGRAAELEAAHAALDARVSEAAGVQAAASVELTEARTRGVSYLRRALLAEHAGQIVPELLGGDDEEALLASVDLAKQAYARALDTARTAIANQWVPAGAPSARTGPADGLSPLEMIASGLQK